MIFCIAENRPEEQIATKVLLLSLQQFCPDVPIHLFFPGATPDFLTWLQELPQVVLENDLIKHEGWEVKVYALLQLFKKGHNDIWWLDSDLLVTCNFIEKYSQLDDNTIVITEEALWGSHVDNGLRTRAWEFPLGRYFPFALNTSVLRVTQRHIKLIEKWKNLLETELYIETQKLPWDKRPWHVCGDQDVLTALLGSKEFEDIPVKVLRLGDDIIQYFGRSGYLCINRVRNLIYGLPPFIHSQGWKPWRKKDTEEKQTISEYLNRTYLDLSPYCLLAKQYESKVNEEMTWIDNVSSSTKLFRILGFKNPSLTGFPLAFVFDIVRYSKSCWHKILNRS
jgi:hypothetical protein